MKGSLYKIRLFSAFLVLLVFFAGCTKEYFSRINDEVTIFRINTRAVIGQSEENVTITTLRILIADTDLRNSIVINRLINDDSDYAFKLKPGNYKVFVIANETSVMAESFGAVTQSSDLAPVIVRIADAESDLVLFQSVDVKLRQSISDPSAGEVSTDGGSTWGSSEVLISLKRVASKISLTIKKNTLTSEDIFSIKKVELTNLAQYSFLLPARAYSEVLQTAAPFIGKEVTFTNNNEINAIFSDFIVPEYILPDPALFESAATLVITADYTKSGQSAREVVYTVPVLGMTAANYSLIRNCHYNITATITKSAEQTIPLTVEYGVVEWQNAGNGRFETGNIIFSGKWEAGTDIADNVIAVSNNAAVTYAFELSFPQNAKWTAQLTNIRDFDFDFSGDGVREGIAGEGTIKKIRIKPRSEVYSNDVMTEFYITVFDGIENIESDLNNDGATGTGKRFIIKQNPN